MQVPMEAPRSALEIPGHPRCGVADLRELGGACPVAGQLVALQVLQGFTMPSAPIFRHLAPIFWVLFNHNKITFARL